MRRTADSDELLIENRNGFDLVVYQCGMEKCKPSHSFGPAIRDYYLIHFITQGKGNFYVDGKSYRLEKGQGFLIFPEILTFYEADSENPWAYDWVGFMGLKAETYLKAANLTRTNPIFTFDNINVMNKYFEDMMKTEEMKFGGELRLQGLLSMFLSELIEGFGKQAIEHMNYKENYIKKTLQYIENNYASEISIKNIADYVGLNRNYYSSVMKKELGVTLQQYVIQYRINKACELLRNMELSIGDVSRSVGYTDPLGFSKVFKKLKGCSPKQYRERKKL